MDTIPSFQNMKHLDPDNEDDKPKEDLDEDIGKIFEGPGPYSDDFSVNELSQPVGSAVWKPGYVDDTEAHTREIGAVRVRDKELHFHRRDSFPHVHHPLKPNHHHHFHHHHRSRRRHDYSDDEDDNEDEEAGERAENLDQPDEKPKKPDAIAIDIEDIGAPEVSFSPEKKLTSKKKEPEVEIKPIPPPPESLRNRTYTDTSIMSTDDELLETSPLLSPDISKLRPCIRPCETDTGGSEDEAAALARKKGRVQFDIGSDAGDAETESKSKLHRKRKHRHRKKESFEDPKWRLNLGSEKQLSDLPFRYQPSEDEAHQLKEHELNEISSHRFEDKGVHRRHRVRAKSSISSIIHPSEKQEQPSKDRQLPIMKKTYDHNPHEVFVELAELQHSNVGGMEWKETARWIKYEEDVEGVDNRWGKPHVAFLNFNSLFSLRKGLERGAVLLDLDEQDLSSIATRVVDHMVACDQIPPDQRDAVIKILLLRHKHIKEHQNAFRRASMRGSKIQLLPTSSQDKLATSPSATSLDAKNAGRRSFANIFNTNTLSSFTRNFSTDDATALANGTKPLSRANSYAPMGDGENDQEAREKIVRNLELLKKIPEGAEATAVLVGAVDFLKQPTIAFVRLAEGVVMENVVEVPIPVRFLFILLGPYDGSMDYHEVGRSISTLMSDKAFHEVAYRAHSRGQLLSAINDFLNASIVFPPSDWNNKDLIDVDEIRSKTQEMIKKTEEIRAKKKIAQIKAEPPLAITGGDDDGEDDKPKRDPLIRKGKLFHGLIQDVKIRYSQYLSDLKDGLSSQVLSATIFIFFAALSPAVTFGGMYADLTDKYIGVGETLLVSSINGMIFALFAAQPLLIVGATGPLMIFDMSLLQFCNSSGLDYLSIRVWVGIWVIIIGLLVAAFEAVSVVKKFTRFTEEIFSTLVCIIFIYGAFEKLFIIFKKHPLTSSTCFPDLNSTDIEYSELIDEYEDGDEIYGALGNGTLLEGIAAATKEIEDGVVLTNQPNTALLSMCLMIGTFLIAWKLKKFRNSKFLGRGIRRALGDFGVPISICLMVLLDVLIQDTYTDKLSMPKGLQPSNSEVRGWLINPFGVVTPLPVWCMFAAGPAALLLFILIFIEENICHLILSKPERCLKKGTGFHLDIVLSCLINTISGFLGAPFMGPACVRTISHMSALTVMSANVAPGESPKIVGCIEQRLSAFTVSLLVGLAVMLYAILNHVPTAVLLGIFLYMGMSATAGIQLLERFILYFMPVKHHPNVPYVKKVRTRKMHAFTAIQLFMLGLLWVVTKSPASLGVPFILICLIPIRLYLLPYVFTTKELIALDGTPKQAKEDIEDEPDFYEASHQLPTQIEANHHES